MKIRDSIEGALANTLWILVVFSEIEGKKQQASRDSWVEFFIFLSYLLNKRFTFGISSAVQEYKNRKYRPVPNWIWCTS